MSNIKTTEMSDETKTYGIEELKKVLKSTFTTVNKVEEAKKDDGKVSIIEAAGITVSALPDAYNTIKNGKAIWNEYQDLDNIERAELSLWFAREFDIADDVAEKKVEAIFNWLMVTDDTINIIIN